MPFTIMKLMGQSDMFALHLRRCSASDRLENLNLSRKFFVLTCPGGEIGRRKGLKILFSVRRVWVQVPPRAPGYESSGAGYQTSPSQNNTSYRPLYEMVTLAVAEAPLLSETVTSNV